MTLLDKIEYSLKKVNGDLKKGEDVSELLKWIASQKNISMTDSLEVIFYNFNDSLCKLRDSNGNKGIILEQVKLCLGDIEKIKKILNS